MASEESTPARTGTAESPFKIGRLTTVGNVEYRHANTFVRERVKGVTRVICAPAADHLSLLLDLARESWGDQHLLMYVLVVSRSEPGREGRYQAPRPLSHHALERFVALYGAFLANDGRHHLWLASPPNGEQTLVYDRHNIIYCYGNPRLHERVAVRHGLSEGPVDISFVHTHHYHEEFDQQQSRLLSEFDWIFSPLQERDGDPR